MTTKKKLELRLTPVEGSKMYRIFEYLIRNDHLVGDGRTMANEAIAAFWLPFALEHEGADPEVVKKAARDCLLLLQRHQFLLAQSFGVEGFGMASMTPVATASPSTNGHGTPEVVEEDTGFMGSIDANYLFDDE